MQAEAARIRVTNNSKTPDLDTRTANYLTAAGLKVTERGGSMGASNRTIVVLYSAKLYALRYLISPLGLITGSQIVIQPDPSQTVDLEIRLGNDWIGKLPAGY